MYDYADAMKLDVDTLIHESGAAQLEVNFTHADAMDLADGIPVQAHHARGGDAPRRVCHLLAKPMENEPGSAMHIHQSPVRMSDGSNVFAGDSDAEGEFSPVFGHYRVACRSTRRRRWRSSRRT